VVHIGEVKASINVGLTETVEKVSNEWERMRVFACDIVESLVVDAEL
jgi:hypothetical protein